MALAAGVKYQSHLVHGEGQDELFLQSLPAVLAQKVQKLVPLHEALPPEDYLTLVGDLVKAHQAHPPTFRCGLVPLGRNGSAMS